MEARQDAQSNYVPPLLPWATGLVALVVYLVTLNHWVSLESLPVVAKATGWDWVLPHQGPVHFLLTLPVRWLPASLQPLALNAFSALCAALTLAWLARSVMLLPHDRTHEQRQRERSEFSLLSARAWWLPPLFAVLVCGFEMTFWEHAVVATGEMLDLLLFAYVIRCLLEYRIDPRDGWIAKFAFVYGLGITNNWAMIAFAPLFLGALLWIRGAAFFQGRFLACLAGFGLLGLTAYLVLPLAWMWADHPTVTFWDALRSNLATQKAMIFLPALRNRALILSLTAVLPVVIIGIRWPSSFGDTSAAGTAMTNVMFRVIHLVLLGACVWVAFGQKFSPRALGFGLPFLTYYYLGALSIGYFTGYALLVFTEHRSKSWRRSSGLGLALQKAVLGLVWLASIAVPAALVYLNFPTVRAANAPTLERFADTLAEGLPEKSALVLSDDPYSLLLLTGRLAREGAAQRHLLVHTRSLINSDYHLALTRRYPQRWPTQLADPDELFDDVSLLRMVEGLSRSNRVYYLHPSFGFYFERFRARPHGLVSELTPYSADARGAVPLTAEEIAANQKFWTGQQGTLDTLRTTNEVRAQLYVRNYYSRALNAWGVNLQRHQKTSEAAPVFQTAFDLNTNNIPAFVNLAANHAVATGTPGTNVTIRSVQERFGPYRLNDVIAEFGLFDHPEFSLRLADTFAQQGLVRQAQIEYERVHQLQPAELAPELGVINVQLQSGRPADALASIRDLRARRASALPETALVDLVRLEASAHISMTNSATAEQVLTEARAKFPTSLPLLDALVQLHARAGRYPQAMAILDDILKIAPDNVQVRLNQATVHFNTKAYDRAIAVLDDILARTPDHPGAMIYKAFVLIETRQFDKAKPILDQVLGSDPDNLEALTYKSVIAIDAKDYAGAVPFLDRVLKADPNNWNAVRNRAIAFLQMGRLDKANEDYRSLSQLMPSYFAAYYGLGEIAYRRQDPARAVRNYERYLKYFPAEASPELLEEKRLVTERLKEMQMALNKR